MGDDRPPTSDRTGSMISRCGDPAPPSVGHFRGSDRVTDCPEESMGESATVAPVLPSEPALGAAGPSAPVPASERLAILDILRGFALFGILTINIIVFKAPWGLLGLGYEGPLADRLVLRAIVLLVESK